MKRKPFIFKRFCIHQENVGMPVTTDACIFGARVTFDGNKRLLDIGSGTGLLSLMIAQRYPDAEITAVELDEFAYQTGKRNFLESEFNHRIQAEWKDIRQYHAHAEFDGIIWNPPFFENQLASENNRKRMARHSVSLQYSDIPQICNTLIADEGLVWLLIPDLHKSMLENLMIDAGFHAISETGIQSFPDKKAHVFILGFSKMDGKKSAETLTTYLTPGIYHPDVIPMLSPFYLHL